MKHVLYGKCVKCGKTYDGRSPDLTNCDCGGILDIVYDYDYIRTQLDQGDAGGADGQLHVALPGAAACGGGHAQHPPAGGLEPPLRGRPAWREQLGLEKLYVKDDGHQPHRQSLKDRASAMAVAKAREAGSQGDRLLLHRQRRLLSGGQRRGGGAQDLHLRPLPGPQGQGGPADDLRRHRHLRPGQLRGDL